MPVESESFPDLHRLEVEIAGRTVLSDSPGEVMRDLRLSQGFTQERLAGFLGIRRESLSRIESGSIAPSLSTLRTFCKVVALSRWAREEVALLEGRGDSKFSALAVRTRSRDLSRALDLPFFLVEEVLKESVGSYLEKREETVGVLWKVER